MKTPKVEVDNSGQARANEAIAQAQQQANTLKQNFATDLSSENITNVKAAGTADEMTSDTGTARKRRQGGGLASQLGINV